MHADKLWAGFLAASFSAFAVFEWTGYKGARHGTLSAALRRWFGVQPVAKRRWLARGMFAGALAGFAAHILGD